MRIPVALFGVALSAVGAAVQSPTMPGRTREADRFADELRRAIRAEIARPSTADWAGEYDSMFGSLILAPKAGFLHEEHGCLGLMHREWGAVELMDGKMRLSFASGDETPRAGLAVEYLPVRWGDRRYLVPASDVIGFCSDINSGNEPRRHGTARYLLRRGDVARAVSGTPTLPAEDIGALLARPVACTVMAVDTPSIVTGRGDSRFRRTSLTLDAGRSAGLRVGMRLYVTGPRHMVQWLELMEVGDRTSTGVMLQSLFENRGTPMPALGWTFSTHAPWNPLPMEPVPPAR